MTQLAAPPLPETVTIRPVQGPSELETFIRLPWRLYRGDPNWVPPLLTDVRALFDPARNPFFEHSAVQNFVAFEGGRPVGRICAIHNGAHSAFYGDQVGFFGFFETERNPAVASGLLRAAAEWLQGRGLTSMRGPMNFSTNDECGLQLSGFERPPVLMMPYNPPWYGELVEAAGLVKCKDLVAYLIEDRGGIPKRIAGIVPRILKRRRIRMRPLDMKNFDAEVDRVREIYNEAWEKNWGFVPMTEHELQYMAKQLKPAVDPELVIFAEIDGEAVGFALAMPDLYQALKHVDGRLFPVGLFKFLWYKRKIRTVRVLTLGIKAAYRHLGIDAALIYELFARGLARGYVEADLSWILEDNIAIRRPIERLGGEVYKTYRIYEAPLERLL